MNLLYWSSQFSLPSAVLIVLYHHARFVWSWALEPGPQSCLAKTNSQPLMSFICSLYVAIIHLLYCFCEVCLSMSRIITALYSQSFYHHQKKPWTQQQLLSISTYALSLCKQVFVSINLSILKISQKNGIRQHVICDWFLSLNLMLI